MASGWYLLGPELEAFEADFARYSGAVACAGVGSGLDALVLSLRVLEVGRGDEVIVPSNTYIATWLAVSAVGATVVPVEPDEHTFNLTAEAVGDAITSRTAAILPVHLYGCPADVVGIDGVARRHGIPVVYDGAQSHGATVGGRPVGAFGDLTAWSFYPGKNLGAFSDGGAVTGRDPSLVARIRRLRNYGSDVKYVNQERGINSRLDEFQAAALTLKLRHLDDWNGRRASQASLYMEGLGGLDLQLPNVASNLASAWHLYVVRHGDRDQLQAALAERKISTLIHYPIPPHSQRAYEDLSMGPLPVAERLANEVLSLPIGPHLSPEQHERVVEVLNQLVEERR
ncbi:MAG: DegT/DnrJ/EryC1/StrS family aminotransferase [Microthrixaceae bacterium]|nr:DegT/DnrJ/EryC1/StrS family aminotransferase [Microthrixaceae bacterium]